MPNRVVATIGADYIDSNSVHTDRSDLISFLEHGDLGSGDVHVNSRGYVGRTTIPTCTTVVLTGKKAIRGHTPCFADPAGARTAGGITATVYRVNQDADQWHILLAWRHKGSLRSEERRVGKECSYRMFPYQSD